VGGQGSGRRCWMLDARGVLTFARAPGGPLFLVQKSFFHGYGAAFCAQRARLGAGACVQKSIRSPEGCVQRTMDVAISKALVRFTHPTADARCAHGGLSFAVGEA